MLEEYYKILGLEKGASVEEIKKAYRLLAKKYHPDVNPDKDANLKFISITEAYEMLMQRSVYISLKATSEDEADKKIVYDYLIKMAREKAKRASKMKYERLMREHEAFQRSGMYDLFLLFNYILHGLLLMFMLFLFIFPVYLAIKYGYFPLFILWIVGGFLALYILGRRKEYFRLGTFFYSFKDLKRLFVEESGKGTENCSYCNNLKADSYPYKIGMLKVHDIQLKFIGAFTHDARYKRSYIKTSIPRCKKAFRIHTTNSLVKLFIILIFLIFLPIESYLWRFILGLIFGGMLSSLVLIASKTRSKVSYLLNISMLAKIFTWLLLISALSDFHSFPNIRPTEFTVVGFTLMLFLQDLLIDPLLKLFISKKDISKPLIKQPKQLERLFNNGYQNYLEIPVWSTIFPLIKFLL